VKLISAFVIGMSVLMSAILVVLPEKEGDYECIGSKWGLRCKRLVCVCYEYHLRDGEVIYNR
jgi:hypothetical protein